MISRRVDAIFTDASKRKSRYMEAGIKKIGCKVAPKIMDAVNPSSASGGARYL